MRTHLISTVGTSLLNNFRRLSPNAPALHLEMQQHVNDKNWGQFGRLLPQIDPSDRICGAEINSIQEAQRRGKLDSLEFLHLLVSDTEEGKAVGEILQDYFEERGIAGLESLRNVSLHVIKDLQDDDPARFKVYGLRNLVRKLGEIVRTGDYFDASKFVIDATGGYKAQIAIAVVFGQALGIPVLYRHEQFSEIIDIPPMPVTFDYDLMGQNANLLAAFERGAALDTTEMDDVDERLRVFLEEIEVDGERIYELGAVGQIFLTGFRLRFPRDQTLKPVTASEKKSPSFRDDHYPIGFREFVEKVCREISWVKTAHSLPYDKQRAIKRIGFYIHEGKLVGTYQDKNRFGARFELLTNAITPAQLTWAADQLNQMYGKDAL
jgi:putative CRISPR-associated protein (TIGR02619 family)